MADRLTILHVLAPAPFGGLESVVRLLALGQQDRGHRVIVAANTAETNHVLVQTLASAGITVRQFNASAREARAERHYIGALIQERRVEVVHTHGYRPDILDLPVARRLGVGSVSTLHGFTGGDWKVRLYEWLQLRAMRKASAVVAVSTGIAELVKRHGIADNRIHLIRNAYAPSDQLLSREDARRTLGLDNALTHVAWIGRLSHEKGPDVMVEAFGLLDDPRVALSLIGDGPMRDMLRARADALGVGARVTFHGAVPNAAQFLRGFDAFALSSRTEGTPMVLFEAMSAEVPIVTTAVGGIPDVVSDNEAQLIDRGLDASRIPAAIANALRTIVAGGPRVAQQIEAAHRRLALAFGVEPWLDRYDALYRSIQQPRS